MADLEIAILMSAAAWLLMGRTLTSAACLVTMLPFLSLGEDVSGIDATDASGASAYKLLGRGVGALLLVALAASDSRSLRFLQGASARLAFGFAFVAILSVVNAPYPQLPFIRIGEWAVFFLAGVVVHSRVTLRSGDEGLVRLLLGSLLPLVAMALFLSVTNADAVIEVRTADQMSRLGGRLIDPQSLGLIGAFFGIAGIAVFLSGRGGAGAGLVALSAFGVGALLITQSHSRTGLLSFAAGAGTFFLLDSRRNPAALIALAVGGAMGVTALPFVADGLASWFLRGESAENLSTGSSRTLLWSALIFESFPLEPLLGHGYLFLGPDGPLRAAGAEWSNAHNAYIFALVSTGIVGFSLLLGMVIFGLRSWFRIAATRATAGGSWVIRRGLCACYVTLLVDACSNYGMVGHPSPAMFLFHLLFCRATLGR